MGQGVLIKLSVDIKYSWKLVVGYYSWIGENVWIDNLSPVKIGSHVCISQAALLLTGNHNYKKITFDLIIGEIILEDGVWVGAHSFVCSKAICHSHSILTVNSVATHDFQSHTIYQVILHYR